MLEFVETLEKQCKGNGWVKEDVLKKLIEYCVDVHETIEKYSLLYKEE